MALSIAIASFGAEKPNANNQAANQSFLDVLQAMTSESGGAVAPANNIPVAPSKIPSQANQPSQAPDKGCTRIIVDNKTVIYNCGDKTFLKRFGSDGGLFLILTDGKKIKLTD